MENKHLLFGGLSHRNAFKEERSKLNILEDPEAYISRVFKGWREDAPSIAQHFKKRDRKSAKEPMIYQLSRFLQVLFWVNGRSVSQEDLKYWDEAVKNLEHLPVNAVERLSFIFEQPDHYHSYIQLSELFLEWEKKSVILLRRRT